MKPRDMLRMISELDLAKIRRSAERPFRLLITGEQELLIPLARHLSSEQANNIHPWLELVSLEASDVLAGRFDAVILAVSEVQLSEQAGAVARHFYYQKIPLCTVIFNSDARNITGAAVPRPFESSRALIPSIWDTEMLKEYLVPKLIKAIPDELKLALAKELPLLRAAIMRQTIEQTSQTNALYSASVGLGKVFPVLNVPLNVADSIIMTKNQLVMAYRLALAAGKQGDPRELLGEMLSVVGGALFFRQVARGAVGLLPVLGIAPKIAVAYGGTQVIGQAVSRWALSGNRMSEEELEAHYHQATSRGRALSREYLQVMRLQDSSSNSERRDKQR